MQLAKLYAYYICKNYRDSYKLFICNDILLIHHFHNPLEEKLMQVKKLQKDMLILLKGHLDLFIIRKYLFYS